MLRILVCLLPLSLAACDRPKQGIAGASCRASSDCADDLQCIREVCTSVGESGAPAGGAVAAERDRGEIPPAAPAPTPGVKAAASAEVDAVDAVDADVNPKVAPPDSNQDEPSTPPPPPVDSAEGSLSGIPWLRSKEPRDDVGEPTAPARGPNPPASSKASTARDAGPSPTGSQGSPAKQGAADDSDPFASPESWDAAASVPSSWPAAVLEAFNKMKVASYAAQPRPWSYVFRLSACPDGTFRVQRKRSSGDAALDKILEDSLPTIKVAVPESVRAALRGGCRKVPRDFKMTPSGMTPVL